MHPCITHNNGLPRLYVVLFTYARAMMRLKLCLGDYDWQHVIAIADWKLCRRVAFSMHSAPALTQR